MTGATVRLSDLCNLISEPVTPGSRPDALYLGLEHLAPGQLVPTGIRRASDIRSNTLAFQPDDVLYGKLRPYLDKAVLAGQAGVCTTELLILRTKAGVVPRFLATVVHSPRFLEYAVAGTTGVQHPRTSWAHIQEFGMPAFTFEEQQRVADMLWLVHKTIQGSEMKRAVLEELFKALLHKLMTREIRMGELNVSELARTEYR